MLGVGEEERIEVTRKEFYKDLFDTVEESGMKMEEVSKALNPLQKMDEMNDNQWEKAFTILASIFTGMRNKGYSGQDLWG